VQSWKVPLADVVVTPDDLDAVVETYGSGWLSMGPRTEALEASFAAYTGARHAIAVTNGTAALHLICLGAGLGPGDEVIVPSLTFVASVNAVRYCGATPVFADIAGLTEPWLSAERVAEALTPRTRAILAVHYGGHPGELAALRRLADEHGLALLEDAAHAAGSRLDGKHLGTFGVAGAFSLFSNKNLAVGEGGMVVTDDDDVAARIRLLRSHGMTTLTWDRHRGHASGYDVVDLGFNYRIDEPRAALAAKRLERLDDENAARGRLDTRYRERLEPLGVLCTGAPTAGLRSSYHLFVVVLDAAVDRDELRAALRDQGIQTSLHYPPVHRFSIYAASGRDLPSTDAFGARAVTLPLFAHMTDEQLDVVVDAVAAMLDPALR
jgi:dTDP-4-amino-4,6-dideoxygalactose transaminase